MCNICVFKVKELSSLCWNAHYCATFISWCNRSNCYYVLHVQSCGKFSARVQRMLE